jgi:hypothetical protein
MQLSYGKLEVSFGDLERVGELRSDSHKRNACAFELFLTPMSWAMGSEGDQLVLLPWGFMTPMNTSGPRPIGALTQ